jgi:hypothetical protein
LPAPTVTLFGTDAAGFALVNVTVTGVTAAPESVTVPVTVVPPVVLAGFRETVATVRA